MAYARERMDADPALAEGVQRELDRIQLARDLRRLREERKLSQSRLATLAGTRQPAIARMERGTSAPNLDTLARVAGAMGLRVYIGFKPAARGNRRRHGTA